MKVASVPKPIGILAELTHRCPLACPYCSNPIALESRENELDAETWTRVFREAADLGILQAHLSGGEPAARRDLAEITKAASNAGIYTNLITSGIGLTKARLVDLAEAGLDHVQISIQDSESSRSDRIAGYDGAFARKNTLAEETVKLGLPLTVNMVVHRANIARIGEMIDHALHLGAGRIEIAHAQYYGWALKNRAALMPSHQQVEGAIEVVENFRSRFRDQIVIDVVLPDYFARYPKACVGGWGRRSLNVTPSGRVLPCHAAESIPGLEFWSVREHSLEEIWQSSPAFNAFRGTDWMQEPCKSCARREQDFGGCRCQAFLITGNAKAADPVCHLSPDHSSIEQLSAIQEKLEYAYRR
jgi:PqqA peptide cyclase